MPPKGKHPKFGGFFTGPLPMLNLRCEWCKQLFQWKPQTVFHARKKLRRTCSTKCAGRLASWEFEKSNHHPI